MKVEKRLFFTPLNLSRHGKLKKKHYVILVFAIAIYGFRYWHNNFYCKDLCMREGILELNDSVFLTEVIEKHRIVFDKPFQLVVFLDFENDCKVCLFEADTWFQPKYDSDDYDVILFLPQATPQDLIQSFLQEHEVSPGHILLYNPEDKIANFHQFGVLKVLVSQEINGILWYEQGTTDRHYERLLNRIEELIKTQCP